MPKSIPECNPQILELLSGKASAKQLVFRKTTNVFAGFKQVLQTIAEELDANICNIDSSVVVEYKDRGEFEAKIIFGGDALVFQMHTNVFTFERTHAIWRNPYVREDNMRGYLGMINMYNFLRDSLRYNRANDEGVLIGRVFINMEEHFFVEGKRQFGFRFNNLSGDVIDAERIRDIVETAIIYALDFDLTTPDFNASRNISVQEIQNMSQALSSKTGKTLGFKFHSGMEEPE